MVVLDAATCGALLGGPYAQGAPQLKLVQKRYLGMHHWLSPIATKDLKDQIVSEHTGLHSEGATHAKCNLIMRSFAFRVRALPKFAHIISFVAH